MPHHLRLAELSKYPVECVQQARSQINVWCRWMYGGGGLDTSLGSITILSLVTVWAMTLILGTLYSTTTKCLQGSVLLNDAGAVYCSKSSTNTVMKPSIHVQSTCPRVCLLDACIIGLKQSDKVYHVFLASTVQEVSRCRTVGSPARPLHPPRSWPKRSQTRLIHQTVLFVSARVTVGAPSSKAWHQSNIRIRF